ncbi:hypothetical protein Tco_1022244 [Tanacetum coccineum]
MSGAVLGIALAYKLTKATLDHLNSDYDDELGLAVNLVMIIYGHLEIILGGDDQHKIMEFYKAPFGKGYSLEWTESYWSWKHCLSVSFCSNSCRLSLLGVKSCVIGKMIPESYSANNAVKYCQSQTKELQ